MENILDINFDRIQEGWPIRLKDFHTLQAVGEHYDGVIASVNRWDNENLTMYGYEINVDDDTKLMLVIKKVGEHVESRLFRLWTEDTKRGIQHGDGINYWVDHPEHEETFTPSFEVTFDEDEGATSYALKEPFPFWDMKKRDGDQVAICEYQTTDDDIPSQYWAKHCLIEWYAFVDGGGDLGFVSVWFGWDIGIDDFEVLEKSS